MKAKKSASPTVTSGSTTAKVRLCWSDFQKTSSSSILL
jgi:hypothetical protein